MLGKRVRFDCRGEGMKGIEQGVANNSDSPAGFMDLYSAVMLDRKG